MVGSVKFKRTYILAINSIIWIQSLLVRSFNFSPSNVQSVWELFTYLSCIYILECVLVRKVIKIWKFSKRKNNQINRVFKNPIFKSFRSFTLRQLAKCLAHASEGKFVISKIKRKVLQSSRKRKRKNLEQLKSDCIRFL